MGRRTAMFLLACLSGCAQIAGIEETSGPDASARVRFHADRVSIGATVVRAPQDLSTFVGTYLVADDAQADGLTRLPAEQTDTNELSVLYPTGTPALMLAGATAGDVQVFDLGARDVTTAFASFEHPAAEPAPMPGVLEVAVTLPTPYVDGEVFQFMSVGSWTRRALEVPALGATAYAPAPFDIATTTSLSGRPHERITTADATLVLRFLNNVLTGVAEGAPFDQGAMNTISGTMVAVTADQTLDVTIEPASVPARFSAVRPGVPAPSMSWGLTASPGHAHGAFMGVQLAAAGVTATTPGAITAMYGNPFISRDWKSVFTFGARAVRTVTPPNQPGGATLAISLETQLSTSSDPSVVGRVELTAGLPELVTVAGALLSTDGASIPRPTRAVPITFTASGEHTLYQAGLHEVLPNTAGTALVLRHVVTLVAATPSFTMPPELFEAGKMYTIRATIASGGFPNVGTGDLAVRTLPVSVASHYSGVFTVMP